MSKEWTKAPGVYVFFELRPSVEQMPDADAGALFKQILRYGETGEETPDDLGKLGQFLWPVIKPKIDFSLQRYEKQVLASEKANKVKFLKSHGITADRFSPKALEAFMACTRLDADGHFQLPTKSMVSDLLDEWEVPPDERKVH